VDLKKKKIKDDSPLVLVLDKMITILLTYP